MLDTDTASYLIKGRHPLVTSQFLEHGFDHVCISVCTVSELLYGLDVRPPEDRLRTGVEEFLQRVHVVPWGTAAARVHARVRFHLDRSGQTIGAMDQMIAAHAISLGLILVTNDVRHLGRLEPELAIENWIQHTS